ncbi:hypothetical protein R9N21_00855, partial [Escherichia coli]
DGDGSHGSTSKTPSYTKSVSWHHYLTRLRLTIADMGLIDEVAIKIAGGIAVVKLDQNTLQVIIGTKVIALRRDMDNYMGIY